MKYKLLLAPALILGGITAANASSFQYLTTVTNLHSEISDLQINEMMFSHVYHFRPVETDVPTPPTEFMFTGRNSSVNAAVSYVTGDSTATNTLSGGFEYMSPDHDFYFSGSSYRDTQLDVNVNSVSAGYFIDEHYLGRFSATRQTVGDVTATLYGADIKELMPAWNEGDYFTVSSGITFSPDLSGAAFNIGGIYHLGKAWAFGGSYADGTNDFDASSLNLNVTHFYSGLLVFQGGLTRSDGLAGTDYSVNAGVTFVY